MLPRIWSAFFGQPNGAWWSLQWSMTAPMGAWR